MSGTDPAPPRVAFQGAPGAFSEEALLGYFRGAANPLPRRSFEEVAEAVLAGEADRGVIPVENTRAGTVAAAYDVLAATSLEVVGEIIHPIRHCLLGLRGSRTDDLHRIISHPVALAQCTRFLSAHPSAESVAVYDTAGAAMKVAGGDDPGVAAVAAFGAAERYGLEVLERDIQDRDDNRTRFYVVRREGGEEVTPASPSGALGTVVVLELEDRPGALARVLEPFGRRGINLTKLESRPAEVPWRYRFLLEVVTTPGEEPLGEALAAVREGASSFRRLGTFPAARRD